MARITIDIETDVHQDVFDLSEIARRTAQLLNKDATVEITIHPYDRDDERAKDIARQVIEDYADNLTPEESAEFMPRSLVWADLIREAAAAGLNGQSWHAARVTTH